MHTKPELLEALQAHRIRLTKRLGQTYLIDPRASVRLLEVCGLSSDDRVVEIGAGLGALTLPLAERVRQVAAIEVDPRVSEVLRTRVSGFSHVQVHCEDVLTVDWSRYHGWKVIGMIPYHITSLILVALSEATPHLADIWLGMQREVAQRLSATPSTKAYGRLTVLAQYRWQVKIAAPIPRHQFFPVPKVDSCWVHCAPRTVPLPVENEALFFAVVKAAFAQRRKTLQNCLRELEPPTLASGLSAGQAAAALERAGLAPAVRGEQLSLDDFTRLSNAIHHR
jgi:16S rRNA (adenine1518-N6/adenine1519-N6)-dimethyltransferase